LDWSKLPDLAAVGLLAVAFATVARRSQVKVSAWWLAGWVMIALHYAGFIFVSSPGRIGALALYLGVASLAWAGILFMWASVPTPQNRSSHWLLAVLLGATSLYIDLIAVNPAASWALIPAAILFGASPLSVALFSLHKRQNSPLRWATVALYCCLSAFLLVFQQRPGNGPDLALNAVLFATYFGCFVHFWFAYRRTTSGAFLAIVGFFAWAMVFVIAPAIRTFLPGVHLESEVWNLPEYVVAAGMILLLLEEQIEHNHYLALHDELTGLPNRRLFQDRLTKSLERARRTGSNTALLVIDLDQFKHVNDTLGHHTGDQVLKRVGAIFSARVRRSDTVARTGGDEFSVILDQPITRADAELVATSLAELIHEPFEVTKQTIQIGASVGIAVFPEDAVDAEGLCIAADQRMYDFKFSTGHHVDSPRPPKSAPSSSILESESSKRAG
jgi:diguanylate cyclase (GGDEF)-like protein